MSLMTAGCAPSESTSTDQQAAARPTPSSDRPDDPDAPRSLALRSTLEFRPLDDHGSFAKTLASRPLPAGIRVRHQPLGGYDDAQEVVFEADTLPVLTQWSAELSPSLPPGLRVVYEESATAQPTLAKPLATGWQLHLLRTDEGFAIDRGTVRLVRSKFSDRPEIEVTLTDEDGTRFAELSERMVDRKLAILQGEIVLSAPLVRERIEGAKLIITLGQSDDPLRAAQALVAKLTAVAAAEVGPPAPLD